MINEDEQEGEEKETVGDHHYLECPGCGGVNRDLWEIKELYEDDGSEIVECDHCEIELDVTASVSYTLTAKVRKPGSTDQEESA